MRAETMNLPDSCAHRKRVATRLSSSKSSDPAKRRKQTSRGAAEPQSGENLMRCISFSVQRSDFSVSSSWQLATLRRAQGRLLRQAQGRLTTYSALAPPSVPVSLRPLQNSNLTRRVADPLAPPAGSQPPNAALCGGLQRRNIPISFAAGAAPAAARGEP